jgi:hypothetical protein
MPQNPKPAHCVGIQWGLWVWNESAYAWVGGQVVPPIPPCETYDNETDCGNAGCYWYNGGCHGTPEPSPTGWNDDFNDNALDPTKWTPYYDIGVSVTEVNQRLEVNVPISGAGGVVGIASADVANKTVTIDIGNVSGSVAQIQINLYDAYPNGNRYLLSMQYLYSRMYCGRYNTSPAGWNWVKAKILQPPFPTKIRIRVASGVVYFEYYTDTWHEVDHENWNFGTTVMFVQYWVIGSSPEWVGIGYIDNSTIT